MRLLLAVDLNDHADELVEQGAAWAVKLDAKMDIIYVDEHAYSGNLVRDPAVRSLLEREWGQIQQTQLEHLARLQVRVPPTACGEFLLRQGRAAEEIVNASKDHDAIILSTHGRRGLAHVMLGSVAERVVRTSPVPVLVLPEEQLDE
jgi:nucleotide-binding universal stress UspA family protein